MRGRFRGVNSRLTLTMKQKPNWSEIEARLDFESVSEKLRNLSASGKLQRRKSASDLLDKVKDALLKARADGVGFAALAAFLTESGLPVSEPTLRQYLHAQGAGKRQSRRKIAVNAKPNAVSQPKAEPKPEATPMSDLIEERRPETALSSRASSPLRPNGPCIADPKNL